MDLALIHHSLDILVGLGGWEGSLFIFLGKVCHMETLLHANLRGIAQVVSLFLFAFGKSTSQVIIWNAALNEFLMGRVGMLHYEVIASIFLGALVLTKYSLLTLKYASLEMRLFLRCREFQSLSLLM